ncbi:MAG: hypothetical protein B6A08_15505 [Sorangiineae bacterium NIC37A_2]|jgi:hypothetical protein|nr:MAG: hypothetical protein B6A08_15505 [Sorangiineae bacterium NIC37A_2]
MVSRLRFKLALSLGGCLLFASIATPGCQKQPEGDRCVQANGDLDCEGGLVCTPASELKSGGDGVSRCCPDDGQPIRDDRCKRGAPVGPGGTGASGNMGGSNGDDGGSGGAGVGVGARCDYTSDCRSPLICGPSGRCQAECVTDRDCNDGKVCDDGTCVSAAGGAAN